MTEIKYLLEEELDEILIEYDNILLALDELHKTYDNTLRQLEYQREIIGYIIKYKMENNINNCNCNHHH